MSKRRPFVFVWKEAVRKSRELSWKAKLVLTMLMDYAAPDGSSCFPSIARLAEDCSLSRSSVKRGLREALEHGFIGIHPRRRGKEFSSNIYELKLPILPPVLSDPTPVPVEPTPPVLSDPTPVLTEPGSTSGSKSKSKTPRPVLARDAHVQPREAQELLALWRQLLGGHRLNPDILVGATYEQLSTAMAWTLWRHRASKASRDPLSNLPGYYAAVLGSCRRGEKRLRAYSRQDMWAIATEDITPAAFFT